MNKATHPPGPATRFWGLPLLRQMRRDYLGFVERLHREHGDLTVTQLGHEQVWDLMSPELAREALVNNADHLIRWERGIEVFAEAFGQSVLITEGALWQRQRRMLMPAFTPKRVAGYATLMTDAARTALDAAVPPGQSEALVPVDALWTGVAMDVILHTLFGVSAQADAALAARATQTLSAVAYTEMFWPVGLPPWLARWLPLPHFRAKRRAMADLKGLIERHIAARHAQPGAHTDAAGDDLLARLLALRDEDTGQALSAQEVFDQCMVSFQAGHETSATTLLWWTWLMARHPEATQRAQAEVDQVLQGRTPTADDLPALPWLTATLKEALRLYPPIAALMNRRTTDPIQLGGWTVPAGAMLRVTPWVIHRDPRWFVLPEAFRPERFVDAAEAEAMPRGAWMPFGTGPRVCIGQHFAMLEITLLGAMLLQRFTPVLPQPAPACTPALNVTLRPKEPLTLRLVRRTAASAATLTLT
jgi:cytochrome P450